jgi:hypothetical protein
MLARAADPLDRVEVLREPRLRDRDLVVPRVDPRDQRHRPEVALSGHAVDRLARVGVQLLEPEELVGLGVHPADHEDAHHAHRQQQHGDHEERRE